MGMYVRFCYVGHGAMNYIQIYDESNQNQVLGHFLVDAGSTDDKTDHTFLNQNLNYIKQEIGKNTAPVIILITHIHEDHYCLLRDLTETIKDRIECLCIGSVQSIDRDLSDPENILKRLWNLQDESKRIVLGQITAPVEMFTLGDVQVYCLWNNYFTNITTKMVDYKCLYNRSGDTNRNENGAAFAFLCKSGAVVFSGDMTGDNFRQLQGGSILEKQIRKVLGQKLVYMTVPHHGSLHSLQKTEWQRWLLFNRKTGYFNVSVITNIIKKVFRSPIKMYISAGKMDKFGHPNQVAAMAYNEGGCLLVTERSEYEASRETKEGGIIINTVRQYEVKDCYSVGDKLIWGILSTDLSNTFSLLYAPNGYKELKF